MRNAKIYIVALVVVCIAIYGGYVCGGNQRQKKLDQYFELLNYSVWATEVKSNIKLIDLIEAKRYKDAEILLENYLDVTLASMSLYGELADKHPDKDIFDAIETARKHREQHPDHKVDPTLANSVDRALNIREKR